MLIISIDRWQVLSYLIRMPLLNQANCAIWQKLWSTSTVLTVFPWILEVNVSKEEKKNAVFVLDSKTKENDKIVLQRVGFKISREWQGLYYNQENWLKDDLASGKPIETITELSFMSFLASGASFLGREVAKLMTKLQEVPRHIKIGQRTFLKVYCSRREASRKTPGSGMLLILPGKCRTFRKCIE